MNVSLALALASYAALAQGDIVMSPRTLGASDLVEIIKTIATVIIAVSVPFFAWLQTRAHKEVVDKLDKADTNRTDGVNKVSEKLDKADEVQREIRHQTNDNLDKLTALAKVLQDKLDRAVLLSSDDRATIAALREQIRGTAAASAAQEPPKTVT